jgi:hypothetical protein
LNIHCANSNLPGFSRIKKFFVLQEPGTSFRNDKILYAGLISLATITLVIARLLTPSAKGYGTHQQLGLPPCIFFNLTGIPCPSCGLTTSVAHAARLQFYQAFLTQPFGLIVFCLTVTCIPAFAYLIRRRISWREAIQLRGVHTLFYLLLTIYLLSWVYKIVMVKMQGLDS